MNFIKFSVDTTNIFPMANTTKGGQLVTEFNLTSRESVSSEESIKYKVGPSYVHAEEDFKVTALTPVDPFFPDSAAIATSILQIAPGRGVIDGRFVEKLVPMAIDLVAVNAQLEAELSKPDADESEETEEPLSGNLAVGLRIMYSSEQTMAGSVDANTVAELDSGEYFEGIQVVILPKDDVRLPTTKYINEDGREVDCGILENEAYVNMHLLLATFTYFNGAIGDIVNNYPAKCQMLPAIRIGAIDNVISEDFLKKSGLNEKKIYALAGKGNTGSENSRDTWCDVTDSLILWDANPKITSDTDKITEIEKISQADFVAGSNAVSLVLPHKQIDGETAGYDISNANGDRVVYEPRVLQFPVADFGAGTPGTVDRNYTNSVKAIIDKINNFYQLTNGKQVMFIEELKEREDLPPINENWNIGDYILVSKDQTLSNDLNEQLNINPPSSLYVVVPGYVREIKFFGTDRKPDGAEIDRKYETLYSDAPDYAQNHEELISEESYSEYWDLTSDIYSGVAGHDYFTLVLTIERSEDEIAENSDIPAVITEYFYYIVKEPYTKVVDGKTVTVATVTPNMYSAPIQLTAQIPFASEETVGGFLNVPESYTDAGYIILDGDGHLRLLDYALLRSGTLAYQLGEDFTVPTGQSIEEVQAYLDEYVNQRIAFPNLKHTQTAENPNIIDIYINLSESEEETTLDIYDIDSRFQTAVRINILGTANDKITINISDCARVIINSAISGKPKINLYRSCLYYDHEVLEYLSKITDMTLWYAKFKDTDPSLLVDGMTVMFADDRGLLSPDFNISSMEFWSPENVNDFHFKVALQSITFSSSGYIVGCGIFVGNDSTVNIRTGKFVCHNNNLDIPQGPNSLRFPRNRLVRSIYVTGQFVSCYRGTNKNLYNIQNTSFSLKTPYYECDISGNLKSGIPVNGEVAFYVDSALIESANPENIDVWESGQFHLFNGSAIY